MRRNRSLRRRPPAVVRRPSGSPSLLSRRRRCPSHHRRSKRKYRRESSAAQTFWRPGPSGFSRMIVPIGWIIVRRRPPGKRMPSCVVQPRFPKELYLSHPVELRPALWHILQGGSKSGRLVNHTERHVRWVLPELPLHFATYLLLRFEVRRVEPGFP